MCVCYTAPLAPVGRVKAVMATGEHLYANVCANVQCVIVQAAEQRYNEAVTVQPDLAGGCRAML